MYTIAKSILEKNNLVYLFFGQYLNEKLINFCDIIQVMFVEIKDKK